MRLSKGGLLVVLALLTPLLVELRVVAGWLNVELSVAQTVLIGLVLVGMVLAYAFWPESDKGSQTEGNATSADRLSKSD